MLRIAFNSIFSYASIYKEGSTTLSLIFFKMDINQIKKYLPSGWDVVDLIDHGIIDLDIMNGKMMGEYVAMLMIRSREKITGSYTMTTFSFHEKDMDKLRMLISNAIRAVGFRNNTLTGDGNTAIK